MVKLRETNGWIGMCKLSRCFAACKRQVCCKRQGDAFSHLSYRGVEYPAGTIRAVVVGTLWVLAPLSPIGNVL